MATIKDIYAGKLDANDEYEITPKEFVESIVLPETLEPDKFLASDKCFVTGFKGTGKSAILLYIYDSAFGDDDPGFADFIRFRSNFREDKRSNFEQIGKKLISYVDTNGVADESKVSYEHLWLNFFFRKMIDDNEKVKLFKSDDAWRAFASLVGRNQTEATEKRTYALSSFSAKLGASLESGVNGEVGADFTREAKEDRSLQLFVEYVDEAEKAFFAVNRTDEPYYLFVDELEAYIGKGRFERDLRLIRDLLFTVKKLHLTKKVRIVCAVRSEVLNAMNRYIATTEMNKITDAGSFSEPLRWRYANTNAIEHPIIQILIKRIAMAEGGEFSKHQRYKNWFPSQLYRRNSVSYILDYGWNKPRDIVRLISTAQQDSVHNGESFFSQAVFDSLKKDYSRESLKEIKEELAALYSPTDQDEISRLFRGRNEFLKLAEIKAIVALPDFADTVWTRDRKLHIILEDLYRVGFIGNRSTARIGSDYIWRWQHKGDDELLTNEGWYICTHKALQSTLTVLSGKNGSTTAAIVPIQQLQQGDKLLQCRECGCDFVFTVGEQDFYLEKGFENEPGKCVECRRKMSPRTDRSRNDSFQTACASCGQIATVPFRPRKDRPVYCNSCFEKRR